MGTPNKVDSYRKEFQRVLKSIKDENLKAKIDTIYTELCNYAEVLENQNEDFRVRKELPKENSNLNKNIFDSYDLDAIDHPEAVNLIEELESYIEKLHEG